MEKIIRNKGMILSCFLVLFSHYVFAADDAKSTSSTPVGLVIWTKGNVTATQPNQPARKLERRAKVFEHDVITTDATSSGEIALTDNSVYTLNPSTTFKVDAYKYKPGGGVAENKTVMNLVTGGFRTITGNIPKENPGGYQVKTPVATIGVRGTQYSTIISKKKGVLFKIFKGAIKVSNKAGTVILNECPDNKCKSYAFVWSMDSVPLSMSKVPVQFQNESTITPTAPGIVNNLLKSEKLISMTAPKVNAGGQAKGVSLTQESGNGSVGKGVGGNVSTAIKPAGNSKTVFCIK